MRLNLRASRTRGSALVLAGTLVFGLTAAGSAAAATAPAAPAATSAAATAHAALSPAGVGTVCQSALPSQADDTLNLIAQGGPFPFTKDGEVFHNYEGILPSEPNGYYHSYTVITPGSSTRGARRIVTADDGTDYYTANHYASFAAIDASC